MIIKHSLVVPCFNEDGNVEKFLEASKSAMAGYTDNYEIIFVNDGSSDNTEKVLQSLFDNNKDVNIKVINLSRNFGKESAMLAGLKNAAGEYVTIIDGDLQQRPEVAVEMGRLLDENPDFDMIAAVQNKRHEKKLMSVCKREFYSLFNKVAEVRFIPDASDFRTMRRNVLETVLSLSEYHRFSKGLFSWVGFRVHTIPYEVKDRESGQSKWSFTKLLRYALDGIMAYTDLPLKLPLYCGAGLSIISVILFIVLLILQLTVKYCSMCGYIVALILLMFGLVQISLGIIGAYLGKVHTQVKNRPIYIVRSSLSYDEKDR